MPRSEHKIFYVDPVDLGVVIDTWAEFIPIINTFNLLANKSRVKDRPLGRIACEVHAIISGMLYVEVQTSCHIDVWASIRIDHWHFTQHEVFEICTRLCVDFVITSDTIPYDEVFSHKLFRADAYLEVQSSRWKRPPKHDKDPGTAVWMGSIFSKIGSADDFSQQDETSLIEGLRRLGGVTAYPVEKEIDLKGTILRSLSNRFAMRMSEVA